jgi:hypothetical protein
MFVDDGGGTKQLIPHAVRPLLEAAGLDNKKEKEMFQEQENNASGFKSYQKQLSRTSRENTTTMHSSLFFHALLGLELKQGVIID